MSDNKIMAMWAGALIALVIACLVAAMLLGRQSVRCVPVVCSPVVCSCPVAESGCRYWDPDCRVDGGWPFYGR